METHDVYYYEIRSGYYMYTHGFVFIPDMKKILFNPKSIYGNDRFLPNLDDVSDINSSLTEATALVKYIESEIDGKRDKSLYPKRLLGGDTSVTVFRKIENVPKSQINALFKTADEAAGIEAKFDSQIQELIKPEE